MPILRAITQKLNVLRPRPHVAGSASSRGTALEALGVERAAHILRRSAGRGARQGGHENASGSGGSGSALHDENQPTAAASSQAFIPAPAATAAFVSSPQQTEEIRQTVEFRPAERPRPAAPRAHTSPLRIPPSIGEQPPVPTRYPSASVVPTADDGDWIFLSPQSPIPVIPSRPPSFAQRPLSGDWLELTPSPAVFPPSSGSRPPLLPQSRARTPTPSAFVSAVSPAVRADQRLRWPTASSPLGDAPTESLSASLSSATRATREPRARTTAMAGPSLPTMSVGGPSAAPPVVARVVQRTTSRTVPPRLPPPVQPPPPVPVASEHTAEPASDHPYATAAPLPSDSPPLAPAAAHPRPPVPPRHDSADSVEILASMLAEFPMPPPLTMPKRTGGGKSGNMAYYYTARVHTPPVRFPSPPQGRCNL